MKYALIKNGIVENIIESDSENIKNYQRDYDTLDISNETEAIDTSYTYEGNKFRSKPKTEIELTTEATLLQQDQERSALQQKLKSAHTNYNTLSETAKDELLKTLIEHALGL